MLVFLGLGSNVGNRAEVLGNAVNAIANLEKCTVCEISSIYETEPWGNKDQKQFLNLVIEAETQLEPQELLTACKEIERKLGRTGGPFWGPRTLDIDLLLYGDSVVDEATLRVPHPQLQRRRFVLVPLAEIAPSTLIPGSGKTVREALETCSDCGNVSLYEKQDDVCWRIHS